MKQPLRYRVYRNLNNGKLSVKHPCGKVSGWVESVTLVNVKLVVNESGRDKVREEQCKNVHAYIEGEVIKTEGFIRKGDNPTIEYSTSPSWKSDYIGVQAYYNPYTTDFWINKETGDKLDEYYNQCIVYENGDVFL